MSTAKANTQSRGSSKPKGAFKTHLKHKKLLSIARGEGRHEPGYRPQPVLVRMDPEPGLPASEKPPVRIFLGTEPAQYRAERVFVWSIAKVRDPSRIYEIYLMKDLEGFDRSGWKTGFTNYRYAIPALAGGHGRAIYNDVDQIYLSDPAELFDADMGEAGVLSIDDKETSVLLIDCEKMAKLWTLEDAHHLQKHKHYRRLAHEAGLWGYMDPEWNSRDSEYREGASKLLHFTTLHTQPWKPFPELLKYEKHAQADLWLDMERAADEYGFTLFTKEEPSPRYRELLDMYATMHEEGRPDTGHSAEETFSGISLEEHVEPIAKLVKEFGASTLLDFGAGKGGMYEPAPGHDPDTSRLRTMPAWGDVLVTCYDPGYEPFSAPVDDKYEAVISTDVLEHIPEEDIAWVLDDLFSHASKFVYVVAACFPAKKIMPDGTNAHCTLQSPTWWEGQMRLAAARNPDVSWVLCAQEKSAFAFEQRRKLTKKGIRSVYSRG